ncbi:MAG: efflux RND transporter permease subunit [Cyclobacteriaceae bacterium]
MILVLLWLGLTAFFGYQIKDLKPDFEFEKFFPTDDPDIAFYESHKEHFGYDNDFLLLIVENETVFETGFLTQIHHLSEQIKTVGGITDVLTPIDLTQLISTPTGLVPVPILHPEDQSKLAEDSLRIYEHPFYAGFFGYRGGSLLIQISHDHFLHPEEGTQLVSTLNQILQQYDFKNHRIVGKLTAQDEFVRLIQEDFVLFILLALMISFCILIIIFRSFRLALLPYVVSLTSLVWLLGLMAATGNKITILGSLIPPIILFVSTSDTIHLMNAYRKSSGDCIAERMRKAMKKVFIATVLTSVTTAIGFFSLLTITTEPVQLLGIFAGIGVIIAFIVTFLFGPILIIRGDIPEHRGISYKQFACLLIRNQRAVLIGSALLMIISIGGIFLLKTDAYLLEDLPESSVVKKDFHFTENEYFGFKPWEIAYWPKDTSVSILDSKVMAQVNKLQRYLEAEYPLGRTWSAASLLKYSNQMMNGGKVEYFSFPEANYEKVLRSARPLITADSTIQNTTNLKSDYGRIIGFIPELGSHETIQRNHELVDFINANIDLDVIHYRLTGTTYLIDKSHELLSKNLLKGLLIAVILVSLVLGIYFKSTKIMLISLIPNIIPLLITAGFMGFTGISLKLTTSIIFAVSFGIAVDDSIHFVSIYNSQKSRSTVYRLIKTFNTAGSAIIMTTMIILAGFCTFLFSSFGASFYLGLFLCLALTSALVIDLTLLPILLINSNKKIKR